MTKFLLVSAFLSLPAVAALQPLSIPRSSSVFRADGLFEGGSHQKANLEKLRLAFHPGFERWVIDFSDVQTRTFDGVAPRFQLRYVHAQKYQANDGTEVTRRPAKFIFVFRSIFRNFFNREKARQLAHKSRFVKDIVLYPPIEEGDMAMEFILKDDVLFAPMQPTDHEGRLVLDLKHPG
jgi:hypothetical protein